MAGNVKGITVEIGGDTTKLGKALKDSETKSKALQKELKQVNTALKFNPSNIELLTQKQKLLTDQIEATRNKLETLKAAEAQVTAQFKSGQIGEEQYRAFQRELIETESKLKTYENTLEQVSQKATELDKLTNAISEQEKEVEELKNEWKNAVLTYGENSDEAKELADQIDKLSTELKENKTKMSELDKAADALDNSLDDVEDEVKDVEQAAKGSAEGFTVMKGVLADLAATAIRACVNGLKELAKQTFEAGANFEAGMSQVQAISGASAEEMERLRDKAKEMGETTKFSATESAEAFNYMAMAGWKTEDMVNGIAGIMNLAAASGEDLATTSDIVTDALTAMGYSAGDAGQLADVMAAASSNANTNVALMGQTFQYAAPIVGALGYNMEDTAVAIGLMANAGIKGQKAGTALRTIMTRLSTDAGASSKQLGALGTITEELGVQFYNLDGTTRPLIDVINDCRKAWGNLSAEQQTSYGKTIAGQEALSGWLALMNAAPADVEKLTSAVQNSSGAAQEMADTMNDNVSGALTLLKSKIEGIMIKVFEQASGSMRKSIKGVSDALDGVNWDKFAQSAGEALETVVKLFTWLVDHGDAVMNVIKAISMAFVTYGAVRTIQEVIGAFQLLTTTIKAGESVMAAFGLTLNPVALGIAAVVAAVGGAALAYKSYRENIEETVEKEYGLTEAQQENVDKVTELTDRYKELVEARDESVVGIEGEYDHLSSLKDEYNGLIDSNGKVKEGYEDRANFILTTLAESMGMEVEEIKQLIEKNGQLGESIDKVMEKKRASATLNAYEQEYTEAIKNQSTAYDTWQQAVKDAEDAQKKYNDTKERAKEVEDTYNQLLKSGSPEAALIYKAAHQEILDSNEKAKEAYKTLSEKAKEAEDTYRGYQVTIQNYEGLSAAIISGDTTKINDALTKLTEGFLTSKTATRDALQEQYDTLSQKYKDMKQAVADGTPGITEENLKAMKQLVSDAKTELSNYDKAGAEGMSKLIEGMQSKQPDAKAAGEETVSTIDSALKELETVAQTNGGDAGNAFALGLSGTKGAAKTAGDTVKQNAEDGLKPVENDAGNTGKNAGDQFAKNLDSKKGDANKAGTTVASNAKTGAESVKLNSSGQKAGDQYKSSLDGKKGEAKKAGANVANNAKGGAESVKLNKSGQSAGDQYNKGIDSKKGQSKTAGSNLAKQGKSGAESIKTKSSGENFGQGFINGINNKLKGVWNAAVNLAKKALAGLKAGQKEGSPSKLTRQSGIFFDEGYILGIQSKTKEVQKAARELSNAAVEELDNVPTPDFGFEDINGLNFGRQLDNTFSATYTSPQLAAMENKLDAVIAAIERNGGQKIVLDTGVLVGETVGKMDDALATTYALKARGV